MADNDEVIGQGELRSSAPAAKKVTRKTHDGKEKSLEVSTIDGRLIFEGDIIVGRGLEQLGVGITGPTARWPKRTVIFEIDPLLPNPKRVTDAIAHWEAHTFIRFKKQTNEKDFVRFVPGGGCSSAVGKIGGVQFVTLGPACTAGNAIHEIGHTVGLWHEQSREDRDKFVTIKFDNIIPSTKHNFDQHIADGDDLGPYDYGSIMHYPKIAFAIDQNKPTIVTLHGEEIGQREALSAGDIAAVTEMYKDVV
jgi:hypothetical protein